MITSEQKELIDNWISDCSTGFEEGAFTDMSLKGNIFGLSGNTCDFARDIQDYIDELVENKVLKRSCGFLGTLYWRDGDNE
tara:strand:- start:14694 stop:14936 length:243 start_codon:yes stop_codon:yes gene_type:complete